MNRNKKPPKKENIFYFTNVWLLHKVPPTVWLPKVIYLATSNKHTVSKGC